METLRMRDLSRGEQPIANYFGNGGAQIVDDKGNVVARIPRAIEPEVAPSDEDAALETLDSDWLD